MSRRPLGVLLSAAVAGAAILTLVSPSPATPPDSRQAQYAAAAAEFGVPESILLAVSYLESRWDFNAGTPSTGGGYGPMHLTDAAYVASLPGLEEPVGEDRRGDDSREELPGGHGGPAAAPPPSLQTIDRATELSGVSKETLRSDAGANIRGGAALLARYQAEIGAPAGANSDPGAWYGAVAKYSGADTEDAAKAFADEVFTTIREGAARVTDDGHNVQLAPTAGSTPSEIG